MTITDEQRQELTAALQDVRAIQHNATATVATTVETKEGLDRILASAGHAETVISRVLDDG